MDTWSLVALAGFVLIVLAAISEFILRPGVMPRRPLHAPGMRRLNVISAVSGVALIVIAFLVLRT